MKVVVVGLGLIGGSLAIDIKALYEDAVVFGIDHNKIHVSKALELSIIDKEGTRNDYSDATLVFLCIPVDATTHLLVEILDLVPENAVVVDMGSTKEKLCASVSSHAKRRNYLAAHPIAGTEFSGPEAAIPNLFRDKTNIICEVEKTAFKLQERVLEVFNRLGMRIRYMDPAAHDRHIAYVSHLSHISSFMLGKTVMDKEKNERDIFDMAGSGFASTVRLAKSSPAMWAPIFKQNKENVVETLEEYIGNLEKFRKKLLADDFSGIYEEMENVNHISSILKGIK